MTYIISALMTVWLIGSSAFADDVRYVALPQQALVAFLNSINEAKSTIDIATFIYQPCDTSVRILTDALVAKAKSGVRVRVLVDGLQQPTDQRQPIEEEFATAGIQLRYYSDSPLTIDYRLHAKFIVVDRQVVIMGGRNWSDEYFDLSPALNYVDRDIWMSGASALKAGAGFENLWNSDMANAPKVVNGANVNWNSYCGENLNRAKVKIRKYLAANGASILQTMPLNTCSAHFAVDDADFFRSEFGPEWNGGEHAEAFLTETRLQLKLATTSVLKFLSAAAKRVQLENYLYIPTTALDSVFTTLRSRNVTVQVLTNQDIESEGPDFFVQAEEYEQAKYQALENTNGEQISLVASTGALSSAFSLTPQAPFFIHSKVAVRDQSDLLVGSFNMDSRSANINVEATTTLTGCPELANEALSYYGQVVGQHFADLHSSHPPAQPVISEFAKIFGDTLLSQF